jgi:signal transduction histidine kinase
MKRPGDRSAILRRRPIRLRLTVTYGLLFLLAGGMLTAFTYVFFVRGLSASAAQQAQRAAAAVFKHECAKALAQPSGASPNTIAKCSHSFSKGVQAGAASQRAEAVQELLVYSLLSLGVMSLLSAVAGWLAAGRALRPVHAITAAARRASQENLSERLALGGPSDELRDLADTYDAMLARLEASFASQRRFVANASHELRTPLTVMRTAIDVTLAKPERTPAQLEDMALEVRQAADRAEELIEALLTLARSDRGVLAAEPADLAVLAEDALDAAAGAIRAAPLQLTAALEAAPTSGDLVLLGRLVGNLIDNAIRHNPPGGWIQVASGLRGGAAYLAVANGGPVIPPDAVGPLFEPFRRLGGRTGAGRGSGLGLSIVASVAAAHQGTATARGLPAGGLEVSVTLPARPGA